MTTSYSNYNNQEESDLVRILTLFTRKYKTYLFALFITFLTAFLINRYSIPVYKIKSSLMILEEQGQQTTNVDEYINNEMFGLNQSFQNQLYVLQSTPVVKQTVENLDLVIRYLKKEKFRELDAYKLIPIHVLTLKNHVQPVNAKFFIAIHNNKNFTIKAEGKEVVCTNLYTGKTTKFQKKWSFEQSGKFGQLVENEDMAFIIQLDSSMKSYIKDEFIYGFTFNSISSVIGSIKNKLDFNVIDRDATVIEIGLKSKSKLMGVDVVNELMNVYSTQNVNRKNHNAEVTIEYIERQLGEISDSLSQTEDNLQRFRSSRQLLNVTDQASGMSEQYMQLQNQLAELITRKRYYNYLTEYMANNKDFSNIMIPSAMGVQETLLNELVSQLINVQAQRSNLIKNRQERNPLVQRLEIQIEDIKKTISDNISSASKTTDISIDEMNKRISRIKSEISSVPVTQRQLSGIERNYRLNDAIYNYLLEKRAEAKISQASNLPDNIVIESASPAGLVSPNTKKNYAIAFILGMLLPFAYFFSRNIISEKIEYQQRIDYITDAPLMGKIPHTRKKTNNVLYDFPKSTMAEAYRALRTNLEFRYKEIPKKIFLVTSSIEGEGKSFNALNLAMSYAQLGKKTILIDFDLRKPTGYFSTKEIAPTGITSYFINKSDIDEIILKTPNAKLDYIPSGPIPPNPVELLASESINDLFSYLKQYYDCIVMDSTPLAQVADAYLLMDYANIKIIIARYNYTLKRVFHMIMNDLKEKNIENYCVVMNDNKIYTDQYGYGYGYESKKTSKKS